MSPRSIRRIVWLVFVAGIVGMIIGSVKDSNGFAVTAGLVTAVGAVGLILVTSVAPTGSFTRPDPDVDDDAGDGGHSSGERRAPDPVVARDVERRIVELTASGADEEQVRLLVRRAVELGRGS